MGERRIRHMCRVLGLLVVLVVLGLASTAWLAPPAAAHAELISSSPRDGERLDGAPHHVVLEFTERVQLVRDGVQLLDDAGRRISTPEPQPDGASVMLPLPRDLPTGGYVVSWRVISTDTHPVSGAFSFGVRAAPVSAAGVAATDQVAPGVGPAVAAVRWVSFGGLVLLFGGATFLLLCWPAGRELAGPRRLLWAGWVLAAGAVPLGVLAHGLFVSGPGSTCCSRPSCWPTRC